MFAVEIISSTITAQWTVLDAPQMRRDRWVCVQAKAEPGTHREEQDC